MSDPRTIAAYQAQATRYAALEMTPDQIRLLDTFLAALPPAAHILDLGCGPGLHAAHMMAEGHSVDALDATPAFVAQAQARGVTARLATFDDTLVPASYDGIWASFSLLHAERADIPRHVADLTRALKPGGLFFLGMKTGSGDSRDALGRAYAYFSESALIDLLMGAGLTVTHTHSDHGAGLSGETAPYLLILARKPAHA